MPTKKWLKMSEIYVKFLETDWEVDLSKEAAEEMFLFESQGIGNPTLKNGFFCGKRWMDVTVSQWKKDIITGILFPFELLEDFPEWWLIKELYYLKKPI